MCAYNNIKKKKKIHEIGYTYNIYYIYTIYTHAYALYTENTLLINNGTYFLQYTLRVLCRRNKRAYIHKEKNIIVKLIFHCSCWSY